MEQRVVHLVELCTRGYVWSDAVIVCTGSCSA